MVFIMGGYKEISHGINVLLASISDYKFPVETLTQIQPMLL